MKPWKLCTDVYHVHHSRKKNQYRNISAITDEWPILAHGSGER